ncbi:MULTISPECIES: site-2 protease family protein [Paraclostridium]|uniref:Peptidase n=3 Tax=Paraclostridium TaxID=1849822 RepID=A0A0M3DIY1_9FIRM|nr:MULTISPECIES: site-2 protease family protein [Paraclostridium]KGJ50748.1 peptidase [Clostridium sp. NCR]MCU9807891.1 site-2 protease family protein [Paraclostridium sp. AKS46]MDV8110373.1 site-2 protease family protein [Bacillus sp. BAU-SS-2023]EQK45373.1 peptidase M50 family protein [[Clostridium] bifermentans ATCC 19299] [Paraclostridium bifermentans ATCC 19299]KKY02318.1 peptidase [Paraclostridium benzoelyticum]
MNMLSQFLVTAVGIAVAISVHEFGHAYVAHLLGDDTAKMSGRMTLDPLKHLDPLGLIMLIIARFGWAKPVPVNPNNFKNYKVGNLIVSLAGPAFNLLTAIIFANLMRFANIEAILIIFNAIVSYCIGFAAFNLLPLPPLDGWGIISTFIPLKYYDVAYKYESMSTFIFILLILTNFHLIILNPIVNVLYSIVATFII